MTIESFLTDWAKRYIENKDIIAKKIVSIQSCENGFHVKYTDKELDVIVVPFVKEVDSVMQKLQSCVNFKTLVLFNTSENIKFLVKNWDKLVSFGSKLHIYFVNPFSKTDKIWIICPYTHDFIADRSSLELGLKTISENVEYITSEKEIEKIINS